MKIKIDQKEIVVTDPNKNIVEIAEANGITITAPCFRNKKKHGCCNACVVEIDGIQNYACATKPQDGMNITYNREDLTDIRKVRLEKYAEGIKNNGNNECGCSEPKALPSSLSCGCSSSSCCD